MTLAVTGWGCVTPFGQGADALFQAWLDGACAIRPVRRFDTSALGVHLGGEMPDDGEIHGLRGARHLRRALDEALLQSRLPAGVRVAAIVATTKGFLESGSQAEQGHPAADVGLPASFVADELRERYGCPQPRVVTVSTACASGLTALALAPALAEQGAYDAVLCVGVDLLSDFVYRGFAALSAIDVAPCRPFDVDRAGMSASEASAALVLEDERRARDRGAYVLGRILGTGLGNDATHPTAPDRDGVGMVRAIEGAMRAARVSPGELGHVHAHGTATVFNDAMELRALEGALGPRAAGIPVTALKGSLGHTFGPSAILEVIASLESVRAGVVPPIATLVRPQGRLDVLQRPRRLTSARFLKTSAGFGGFDGAVVAEGISP